MTQGFKILFDNVLFPYEDLAKVGQAKTNKLGERSQLREAKLEELSLEIRGNLLLPSSLRLFSYHNTTIPNCNKPYQNRPKLQLIRSNWIRLDQIGSNWIKLDQIGSNWIKLDQIGSN